MLAGCRQSCVKLGNDLPGERESNNVNQIHRSWWLDYPPADSFPSGQLP
jgi:hypothetical protein